MPPGIGHRSWLSTVEVHLENPLSRAICDHVECSAIVHIDDVAWNEPYFRWEALLRDQILRPLLDGRGVNFTPPMWKVNRREGAIKFASGLQLWVQSDFALAEVTAIARDMVEGVNGNEIEIEAMAFGA